MGAQQPTGCCARAWVGSHPPWLMPVVVQVQAHLTAQAKLAAVLAELDAVFVARIAAAQRAGEIGRHRTPRVRPARRELRARDVRGR